MERNWNVGHYALFKGDEKLNGSDFYVVSDSFIPTSLYASQCTKGEYELREIPISKKEARFAFELLKIDGEIKRISKIPNCSNHKNDLMEERSELVGKLKVIQSITEQPH